MKRHKISDGMWIEDPCGEWMKWEDVDAETKRIAAINLRAGEIEQRQIRELKAEISRIEEIYEERIWQLKKIIAAPKSVMKCNCRYYSKGWDKNNSLPNSWICPAHGYKRR